MSGEFLEKALQNNVPRICENCVHFVKNQFKCARPEFVEKYNPSGSGMLDLQAAIFAACGAKRVGFVPRFPLPVLDAAGVKNLPDNNPKTVNGMKKAPLHLVPPSAIVAEAGAFKLGAARYGPYNWREDAVSASIYIAAAMRHMQAYWDGEKVDPESGALHLGHARACLAILIDAEACEKLNDDRPSPLVKKGEVALDAPSSEYVDPNDVGPSGEIRRR